MSNGFLRKNLFLIVGLALIAFGVFTVNRTIQDKKICTEEVTGVVSDYKVETRTEDGKKVTYYYPIFTYTVNGAEYTQKYSTGGPKDYEIGDEVLLMYEPAYPQNFIIAGESPLLVMGIINGVLGIVFVAYNLKAKC